VSARTCTGDGRAPPPISDGGRKQVR